MKEHWELKFNITYTDGEKHEYWLRDDVKSGLTSEDRFTMFRADIESDWSAVFYGPLMWAVMEALDYVTEEVIEVVPNEDE